jgi:Tetracyclin repressor-like, C-terminal domain
LRLLIAGAANWTTAWFDPGGPATPSQIADLLVRVVFDGAGSRDRQR